MSVPLFRRIVIAGVLQIPVLMAQTPTSLEDFFHALTDRYDPSAVPTKEDASKFENQIEASPPEEVSRVLPLVFAAVALRDEAVAAYGAEALISTSLRIDGAELLRPHLDRLYTLLNSPDSRLANIGLIVLAYQRPKPQEEITGPVLAFARRTDRNSVLRARALGALLYAAYIGQLPDRSDIVDAIEQFMSSPLDQEAGTTMLDAIGAFPPRSARNEHLVAIVLTALHNPSSAVRSRAIYNIERLGRETLEKAAPDLRNMAVDPKESAETRGAADRALRAWVGGGAEQGP